MGAAINAGVSSGMRMNDIKYNQSTRFMETSYNLDNAYPINHFNYSSEYDPYMGAAINAGVNSGMRMNTFQHNQNMRTIERNYQLDNAYLRTQFGL
jgi:hypothetical protein